MFDATWVAGGAYLYHLTEEFAVEASAALHALISTPGPELERTFSLLEGTQAPRAAVRPPTWSSRPSTPSCSRGRRSCTSTCRPRWAAGWVDFGADQRWVAGPTPESGSVLRRRAVTIRLDLRDHIYQQQLLSADRAGSTTLSATIGVGLLRSL
jgi:hypothetical protein